eukprot:GHVH01004343.1.p1 GENE.GHVH01004343.1~~GHVH01004343.1.p1  ORF type:complete len:1027 (+),score=99.69 GHVH01004343.1:378-3458(+)
MRSESLSMKAVDSSIRKLSSTNDVAQNIGPLFKVNFTNRITTGEVSCVEHHELKPVVSLMNLQTSQQIVTDSRGVSNSLLTVSATPTPSQDADIIDRVYRGHEDPANLSYCGTAMVSNGIELSYQWHKSPPRAVCWFHQHRHATVVCTITDRNFCSLPCYQTAFTQIRRLMMSQEIVTIPGGYNPMTRGLLTQILKSYTRQADDLEKSEAYRLMLLFGMDPKSTRLWGVTPKTTATWPVETCGGTIDVNREMCDGFLRDQFSQFFYPSVAQMQRVAAPDAQQRHFFQPNLTTFAQKESNEISRRAQHSMPFAVPPILGGGGAFKLSTLWAFYRQLRGLKVTVSPSERKKMCWSIMSTRKAITPSSDEVGRELKFTVKFTRRADNLNLTSGALNPVPYDLKDVFNKIVSPDTNSVEKVNNQWSSGTGALSIPEGAQKAVSGTMVRVPTPEPPQPPMRLDYTPEGFSILSWNILADTYATEVMFHHITPSYLKWDYRKHFIFSQIQAVNPDVICFQELQNDHYNFFEENLRNQTLGYAGFYKSKRLDTYNAVSGMPGVGTYISDGCAIFYKVTKFQPVLLVHADYGNLIGHLVHGMGGIASLEATIHGMQCAREFSEVKVNPKDGTSSLPKEICTRLFKDNVLQIVALETLPPLQNRTTTERSSRLVEGLQFHKQCTEVLYATCPPAKHPMENPESAYNWENLKSPEIDSFTLKEIEDIQGNLIIVGNTHILANPEVSDTKYWQTSLFMRQLDKVASGVRTALNERTNKSSLRSVVSTGAIDNPAFTPEVAVLICGDFNSMPGSIVYSYLIHGKADWNHPEIECDKRGLLRIACNISSLEHKLKIRSMNAECLCVETDANINRYYSSMEEQNILKPHRQSLGLTEPLWTNSTPSFAGCLDYVFYEYQRLKCTHVMRLPSQNKLYRESEYNCAETPFLPMISRPSDHVPVFGKFQWWSSYRPSSTAILGNDGSVPRPLVDSSPPLGSHRVYEEYQLSKSDNVLQGVGVGRSQSLSQGPYRPSHSGFGER